MKLRSLLVLVFLTLLFVSGLQAQHTIKGRVLDQRGFPVPLVSVNANGGAATTDKDGRFTINVEKLPYYLGISDNSNNVSVLYEDMTRLDPEVTLFGVKTSKFVNTEAVKITFPPVASHSSALIKFISTDLFYSEDITATSGETTKLITVDWPDGVKSVNGRIIYLEKTSSSYTKYFEKAITVLKDFNNQVLTFDGVNFLKPGEASINVYLPPFSFEKKGFAVYADFLSLHRNSQILLTSQEGDIVNTKILVPGKLPLSFRLRVEGNAFYKGGDGFENSVYSYPGSSLNISTEEAPELLAPQDKAIIGPNNNTEFSYEWGSGTGVYVVHFHSYFPEGDFYIVTNKRSVSNPIARSGGVLKGNEFNWSVTKHLTNFNINDFTKPQEFSNDVGYKAVTYSETRTFKQRL